MQLAGSTIRGRSALPEAPGNTSNLFLKKLTQEALAHYQVLRQAQVVGVPLAHRAPDERLAHLAAEWLRGKRQVQTKQELQTCCGPPSGQRTPLHRGFAADGSMRALLLACHMFRGTAASNKARRTSGKASRT